MPQSVGLQNRGKVESVFSIADWSLFMFLHLYRLSLSERHEANLFEADDPRFQLPERIELSIQVVWRCVQL